MEKGFQAFQPTSLPPKSPSYLLGSCCRVSIDVSVLAIQNFQTFEVLNSEGFLTLAWKVDSRNFLKFPILAPDFFDALKVKKATAADTCLEFLFCTCLWRLVGNRVGTQGVLRVNQLLAGLILEIGKHLVKHLIDWLLKPKQPIGQLQTSATTKNRDLHTESDFQI